MRLSRRGKRRLIVVLLAALAIAAALLSFERLHSMQQQRLIAEARRHGLQAYRAGDLQRALNELKYFVEHHDDDLEVNLVLAEARARVPMQGGRHLLDAVDLYTVHGLSLLNRSGEQSDNQLRRDILRRLLGLYAQLGDRPHVEQTADALLKIDPLMVEAMAAKAEVTFLSRRFDEAEEVAGRLIELDPDNLTWRRMVLEARSRQGAAHDTLVRQCKQWSEGYRGDARMRLLTASVLVDAGRTDEARRELKQVASLEAAHGEAEAAAGPIAADSTAVLEQLVSLMDVLGLRSEADAVLRLSAQRHAREWWPREVAIRRAWQDGRPEHALHQIAEARNELGASSAPVTRLEIVALAACGRSDEARLALDPLLHVSPANKELDADRTWATAIATVIDNSSSSETQWRLVVTALQAALSVSPQDPVLHELMGDACARVGEYPAAIDSYRQAYALAPNWMAAGMAYGQTLLAIGRLDEALDVARTVLGRSAPDRIEPFLLYARACLATREAGHSADSLGDNTMLSDIIAALKLAYAQHPDDPEVAPLLARALVAAGNRSEATDLVRSAISSAPETADVLLALAAVSRSAGLGLEQSMLARARQLVGLTLPVALAEAKHYAQQHEFDRALQVIDQALTEAGESLDKGGVSARTQRAASCARVAYALRGGDSTALASLAALVKQHADAADVQCFALSQSAAWGDQRLIATAMGNLHRILGDDSMQVRLAEANFLIQAHAREPAMLAKAISAINGVLDKAPDSLAALSLAAEAFTRSNPPNLDAAVAHLQRAVALYPAEPSLLVRLIGLLQRQGRFDAARGYLQSLARFTQPVDGQNGQPSSVHPVGDSLALDELRLLQAQGDFETALVRASATVDDSSPLPQQLLLAAIEERLGHLDRAEDIYSRLLSQQVTTTQPGPVTNPDVPIASPHAEADTRRIALAHAAEFYASTGRFARGLELIHQIPIVEGEPPALSRELLMGTFCERHGRLDEAEHWLRAAVLKNPDSADARNELARHNLKIGERAAARDEAMQGLRIAPQHAGLRATLAIASLEEPEADRRDAIRLLREIGAPASNDTTRDALLAMLELLEEVPANNGRFVGSSENLERARELTEQHGLFVPIWQVAIALHVESGNPAQALALARRAVGRLPGDPQPSEWATELLIAAGRWEDALLESQEWRRRSLANPTPADCATAGALLALGRAGEALARLQSHEAQITDERRLFPAHLAVFIEALVRNGETQRAAAIMEPLLSEDARWRHVWIAAAELMDESYARETLARLGESIVHDAEERLAIAMQWLRLAQRGGPAAASDLERAFAAAEQAASEPLTAVGGLITLGAIAEERGEPDTAEQHYRAALTKAPENPVALNNLAYVLARQPLRAAEALSLIDRALRVQPDQPDFLDTRGVALMHTGRTDEAELALRRALELRPEDPGIMVSLAEVHLAQGREDDAAVLVERVRRRPAAPEASVQRRLQEMVQRLQGTENAADAKSALP